VEAILEKILDYIKEQDKTFKVAKNSTTFVCPVCKHPGKTASLLPGVLVIRCANPECKDEVGNIIDIVRHFESDKKDWDDVPVLSYLGKKYNLPYVNESQVDLTLKFYAKNHFDLVPAGHNQKIPIEKAWPTKNHKDIAEWKDWLNDKLNIGVKTGKISGVTVVDIDQWPIPAEIAELLGETNTLYQRTAKGCHFFYKYESTLPKTRIGDLLIDIENDGGQVIVPPSTVDGKGRKMELYEVQEMPTELKQFLIKKTQNNKFLKPIPDPREVTELNLDNIDFNGAIGEGNRHHNFMKFGGLLRKQMNLTDVAYTLGMINKYLCDPPLTYVEIKNIVNSVDRYTTFDEKELSYKIIDYVEKVEEATSRDVKEALGYKKEVIDTLLSNLVKEGYLIKKRRVYKAIKKMQWRDEFMEDGNVIGYKMPYFDDLAQLRDGDLVILGAKTGVGKSHIAVNIMKRLVEQGIKPKYVNLESANRFLSVAKQIGLKEGDFEWVVNFSPETMELDDDSFTIIDWLLPNDYAETDKIYKYFAEQLGKHRGILLVFVQLKATGEWFAPNQIEMFPALAAKFGYEDEQGSEGAFTITKIREAKTKNRFGKIKTKYLWGSKELITWEEHDERYGTSSSTTAVDASTEVDEDYF